MNFRTDSGRFDSEKSNPNNLVRSASFEVDPVTFVVQDGLSTDLENIRSGLVGLPMSFKRNLSLDIEKDNKFYLGGLRFHLESQINDQFLGMWEAKINFLGIKRMTNTRGLETRAVSIHEGAQYTGYIGIKGHAKNGALLSLLAGRSILSENLPESIPQNLRSQDSDYNWVAAGLTFNH